MFKLTRSFNGNGTSLQGKIYATYKNLFCMFGASNEADNYKVSDQWIFTDKFENVITLYNWKSTSLYSSLLPSPERLRAAKDEQPWHIGATHPALAKEFKQWLKKKLNTQERSYNEYLISQNITK